jgi:hypothetical protein
MISHICAISLSQSTTKYKDSILNVIKLKDIKIDSLIKIDWLSKEYIYLDDNFKPNIDSITFKIISKNRRVNNYNDTLKLLLKYQLKDFDAERIALNTINFKWSKLSLYLFIQEKELKKEATLLGYTHPYRYYEYLIPDDIDEHKSKIFQKIEQELKELGIIIEENKSYKDILRLSFKNNPERIKLQNEYLKKNSHHKH